MQILTRTNNVFTKIKKTDSMPTMKKMLGALLLGTLLAAPLHGQTTQEKPSTNRYAMKLQKNEDGSYSLLNEKRYAKLVDLNQIDDLLVPYVHQNNRLSGRDYKGVEVREVVYRTHEGYELTLAIDLAESEEPAPVVFYVHGGGWARGSKSSPRVLSQYMAKQKGITGVRVSYSLAPQPGATVEVSIADLEAAVEYIRAHAQELHIDPTRMGFYGTSAGAHLAAMAAVTCSEARAFVGVSGIYDLETAAICIRARQQERIDYFCEKDAQVLHRASPIHQIGKRHHPDALLFCGTADITVEWEQSRQFAEALQKRGAKAELAIYENYDHNLSAKASDKMEEIFFKTVDFLYEKLQ